MFKIFKIEINKIIKSQAYIPVSIVLGIFMILSFYLAHFNPTGKATFLTYYYFIFAVKSQFFFPLAITVFFSTLIIYEYKHQTYKILFTTKFNKTEHFIGKFTAGSFIFLLIFITFTLLYMLIALLFSDINDSSIEPLVLIYRMVIISIAYSLYLLTYGSFIMMLSTLTRNYGITTLISIGLLLLFLFIPIPASIRDYIFLKSYIMYTAIADYYFDQLQVIRFIFVDIITLLLFLSIGSITFNRKNAN